MTGNLQNPATPALRLVRSLASEGNRIFTVARAKELSAAAGLTDGYLRQALHHLTKSGWLLRLRKGLYALSPVMPGVTSAHEFEIAMALVPHGAVSHWSAMQYHGMTEQIPRKVFVLTSTDHPIPQSRSKDRREGSGIEVAKTIYQFIRVKPERFFGTDKVWVSEARVMITDPERTLLDGLMMPWHCGDFAEVLHAFEVRKDRLNLDRIVGYALRVDAAAAKRLGWVLEQQGVRPDRLASLLKLPIKGYRTLDPNGPRKGPCNSRWMIQENLPGNLQS